MSQQILVNKLLAIPSSQTLEYLGKVLSGCPFDLDLHKLYVEINSSEQPMVAQPMRMYSATVTDLDVFYESGPGVSQLVISLESSDLLGRYLELQAKSPNFFYPSTYFPHVVLKTPMPALPRHWRAFINSVANSLMAPGADALQFDGEMVVPTNMDLLTGPFDDYYEKMETRVRYDQSLSRAGLRSIL